MSAPRPIGVLGAGVMGQGVAQALAQTGHHVVLVDVTQAQLERAKAEIAKGLRFRAMLEKVKSAEPPEAVQERIRFTLDYGDLAEIGFLVENVTERWETKKAVYQQVDPIAPADCIFAVNTSAIPITRVAAQTQRRERVIGMHFMNPVPLKPCVEVIRGFHTTDATVEGARAFLKGMGKEAIVVNDSPGFVSNRVLMLTINEAVFLVHEGVSTPADVDRIFRSCFGHKMGPLETGDLIGLDTILLSLEVLYENFNDPKFRPCPLLRKMVDAGLHGRKSGQGFFKYQS